MNPDLAQRYGRSTKPRWFWPLITVIGVGIGTAFAAWVAFQDRPVSARVWGYDVQNDQLVTITIDVVTPDPLDVTCTVYAQSEDHAIVGEKTVDVPSEGRSERRYAIDVKTERRAVTGVLRTCQPAD